MSVVAGDGQTGTVGSVLAEAFVIRVADRSDVPLPGVAVTWSVPDNQGSFASRQASTDFAGFARAVGVLGPRVGVATGAFAAEIAALGASRRVFAVTAFGEPPAGAQPPLVIAHVSPLAGPAPLVVTLDGSDSLGSGGVPILLYHWDTADGASLNTEMPVFEHTYARPGGYTVRLLAFDLYGLSGIDLALVSVPDGSKQPPVALLEVSALDADPRRISFACNCYDPDGIIDSYSWDLGDGTIAASANIVHDFSDAGTYQVHLVVEDDDGLRGFDNLRVVVPERAPVVSIVADPPGGRPPLAVSLTAQASDADGLISAYRWELPDGTSRSTAAVSLTFPQAGAYTARVEVDDDDGLTASATVIVKVAGPPEIVSSPSTRAQVGVPYTYDEDGIPTARGDAPFFWWLSRGPAGMSVDPETGRVTWTPAADEIGEQTVSLSTKNAVDFDAQSFAITVGDNPTHSPVEFVPSGCRSAAASVPVLLVGLLAWLWRRRSDRRSTVG
jgi:PKD repeat protein